MSRIMMVFAAWSSTSNRTASPTAIGLVEEISLSIFSRPLMRPCHSRSSASRTRYQLPVDLYTNPVSLLISQSYDRVQPGGLDSRVDPGNDTDQRAQGYPHDHPHPGDDKSGIKAQTEQVARQDTQQHAQHPAKDADH